MQPNSIPNWGNVDPASFDAIQVESQQALNVPRPHAVHPRNQYQRTWQPLSSPQMSQHPYSPYSNHTNNSGVGHVSQSPSPATNSTAIFDPDGSLNWSLFRSFQEPRLRYTDTHVHRHRDSLGREWSGLRDDRCLSASDGRLSRLIVQAMPEVCSGPASSTWARTKIRQPTPALLRVMLWVLKDQLEENPQASEFEMCLKWAPACLVIFFLLFLPADLGGEIRNNGRYEQLKYHYWGYASIPRNPLECRPSVGNAVSSRAEPNPISERPLRPRYLCFLKMDAGISVKKVEEWENENGENAALQYLFVSYTSAQFSQNDCDDLDALHYIAEAAARRAGVHAYWISASCMPDENELPKDVYRISDVVRGAHSLIIILGPPVGNRDSRSYTRVDLLREWGKRIWTFPEVLLSPSAHPISMYTRGGEVESPLFVRKHNFPVEAWQDAPVSRQLVDHYESSIILSPLELVTIALQCLESRVTSKTYLAGDMSYALMGLLRRRPEVDEKNTAFQAFCRLSLSNDSNQLLERLICLLPKKPNQPWHTIDDFWGSNLWDIDPLCQVVGLGGARDSVILSGAFGSPIQWGSFEPVNLLLRNTIKRVVAKVILRAVPAWFVIGAMFLGIGKSKGGIFAPETAIGWLAMGFTIIVVSFSPYLLKFLYVGKTWSAQPWLFGFEGYMPIASVETALFGMNLNRLKWSPYSSELSRHCEANGECVGIDPLLDADVKRVVEDSRFSEYGQMKLFTLVDTCTMTVTLFRAVRPPVAMLLCGSEGGMLRALLCSYDWTTQTLYRESVLRVDTMVLEKMPQVKRFQLGLQRPLDQVSHYGTASCAEGEISRSLLAGSARR